MRRPCPIGHSHEHSHELAGKAIKVGTNPEAIAITPDGRTLYVANYGSASVTPIRTATNTPGKTIKVGSQPWAIAIT